MANQAQSGALRKNPFGDSPEDGAKEEKGGVKRTAPASDSILKELEQAQAAPKQKEDVNQKKKRILERCGCL